MSQPSAETNSKNTVAAGFWSEAWKRFRRRKLAMAALIYVAALSCVALFAPAIAGTKPIICKYKGSIYFPALGYLRRQWENPIFLEIRKEYSTRMKEEDPDSWAVWPLVYQDPYRRVKEGEWPGQPGNPSGIMGAPSRHNLFGTDQQGYDVFAQMVHGTKTAMLVGFVSMGIASVLGISIGALAGYFGGVIDIVLSRRIELVMCIPTLVLILSVLAVVEEPNIWHMMVVIGITGWTGLARLTRGEFMKLKELEYVTAARALGLSGTRIMFRHILRNALAPVLVPIAFGIAGAILIESGLSFLGVGGEAPNPSWGSLLSAARNTLEETWWLVVFPGTAIFLTVLAYNLIGEGLQEATDPRLTQSGH